MSHRQNHISKTKLSCPASSLVTLESFGARVRSVKDAATRFKDDAESMDLVIPTFASDTDEWTSVPEKGVQYQTWCGELCRSVRQFGTDSRGAVFFAWTETYTNISFSH